MKITQVKSYWGFYFCAALDCCFKYSYRPGKAHQSRHRPVLRSNVFCEELGRYVLIEFIGMGRAGFEKVLDLGCEDAIFPINLFNRPYRITPCLGNKVPVYVKEGWENLIAFYGRCFV